jgi:hypothetical protein
MRTPSFRKVSLPPPLIASMCGVVVGVLTLAMTAWLYRTGAVHAASQAAEAMLLAALVCVAAAVVGGGPARMRKARVPIGRALPPAWWPRDSDAMPLLAACAGAPIVIGAGAAVLLFR